MKSWLLNSTALWSAPLWAPDDGGTGTPAESETPAATPAETLFPKDGEGDEGEKSAAPPAGDKDGEGEGDEGDKDGEGDAPPEWKEYEPDPNKSDEENAAAKAEHDKAKPDVFDMSVPDNYLDLQMPEGVTLDTELMEAMTPVLKDLFITKDQAQSLVNAFTETMSKRAAAEQTSFTETVDGWAEKAKAEHGTNWDDVASRASGVVTRFGDDELKQFLNATGAGNHPAMIRLFARVGKLIGEDVPDPNTLEGKGTPAEAAHLLYANDAPKG